MTDDLVTWEPNHRPSLRRGCLLIVAWIVLGLALGFAAGRASAAVGASQLTGAGFASVAAPGPSVGPLGAQYGGPVPRFVGAGGPSRVNAPAEVGAGPTPPYPAADVEESVGGTLELPAAVIGGVATWYCGGGSPCTRGHGPDELIAAIDPGLGIRRGERLTVHSGGRVVTVTVVDVCACKGARIVDLSRLAFSRLANPSRGTIPVSISVGGPLPTLPPTDSAP